MDYDNYVSGCNIASSSSHHSLRITPKSVLALSHKRSSRSGRSQLLSLTTMLHFASMPLGIPSRHTRGHVEPLTNRLIYITA